METADARATARAMTGDNVLYMRSADDLHGKAVIDRTGDKVGEIKRVVLAPDRKSAHAVISVGGVLGIRAGKGRQQARYSIDEAERGLRQGGTYIDVATGRHRQARDGARNTTSAPIRSALH